MATYNASKMAAGVQPRALATGLIPVVSILALAQALLLNDVINMLQLGGAPDVPTNFGPAITGVALDTDQLDTGGGGATLKFNLGDANSSNRFISQSTIGQTGGYQAPNVGGWLGYAPFSGSYTNYPTASLQTYTLQLKCQTAPNAWQNGTVRVKCEYTYDP